MANNFAGRFAKLPIEALAEIVFGHEPDAYEFEAIAAALAELRQRRASTHGLKGIVVDGNRVLEAQIARAGAANEGWRRALTALLAPTLIAPWVMAGRLEAKGYFRKATDTRWWWLNSLLAWMAILAFAATR